jgi:hypothetical protein
MRLPLLLLAATLWSAEPVFTVRPDQVLRDGADRWLGINLNYIRDLDANRPTSARPLGAALDDLGVRWLRFPGGEKSDFHRFAKPPYDRPEPVSLGWYAKPKGRRMDFDAYIAACRARGAEPYVVVACDSPERTGATWDEQLTHAVAWVRYAKEHACGVHHWEIGNENWHNQTAPAAEMAAQVVRFARAMKAVDPSIRVGASGNNGDWWKVFLPLAAADLDFLTCSVYNCWQWKSYDRFLRSPEPNLLDSAGAALHAIDQLPPGPDRERLRVIVAETNSRDYSKDGWGHANSLGHALVTFETFGRLLREPRVAAALLWNTRWVDEGKALEDIFYALDDANAPTASGLAVALWGRHLQARLLAVEGGAGPLRAHASAGADGRTWTVWLVNRGREPAAGVRVRLGGLGGTASAYRLCGSSPEDIHPVQDTPTPLAVSDGAIGPLTLPGLSITVISGR